MRADYDKEEIGKWIGRLVEQIAAEFPAQAPLNIVGIRTRGEIVAERIAAGLRSRGYAQIGRGVLDITLYRDDVAEIGPKAIVKPTQLDVSIDQLPLVLVDDVLFTGRTIRAALDALSDFGRPGVIRLAVLAERAGRELPIQPDYVGLHLPDVPRDHRVTVKLHEVDGIDEIIVEKWK